MNNHTHRQDANDRQEVVVIPTGVRYNEPMEATAYINKSIYPQGET